MLSLRFTKIKFSTLIKICFLLFIMQNWQLKSGNVMTKFNTPLCAQVVKFYLISLRNIGKHYILYKQAEIAPVEVLQ